MRKNILELLLAIVLIVFVIFAFDATVSRLFSDHNADDEFVFVIGKSSSNSPFPVYSKSKSYNSEYYGTASMPLIATNNARNVNANFSVSNNSVIANMQQNYNYTSAAAFNPPSGQNVGGSMFQVNTPVMRSSNNSTGNTNATGMRSFYSSSLKSDNWPSKVPFSANTPNDVILVDPKTDPIEGNKIPVGDGGFVLFILGVIYLKLKEVF
jgi:cytoskeletal protein RodZ